MKSYYLAKSGKIVDNKTIALSALLTDGFEFDSNDNDIIDDYVNKYCMGIERKLTLPEVEKFKKEVV